MNEIPILWPQPGRYLLAVSGGADSMVMLDVLAGAAGERGYHLHVGHVDHGLRPDSAADRQFVEAAAASYNLPFAAHEAALPPGTSEAVARHARHAWLESERARIGAAALITAHHQNDLIETSLLNLARGTNRHGLAPMQGGPILRPLLGASREQLRQYAASHGVTWHEDSTNADLTNPRNLLRRRLLPAATPEWRARYTALIAEQAGLNAAIDTQLSAWLTKYRQTAGSGYAFPASLLRNLSLVELAALIAAAASALDPAAQLSHRLVSELALFAATRAAPPPTAVPGHLDHQITLLYCHRPIQCQPQTWYNIRTAT
jgi:tRNA(Ile)-lysidine synthetase-like protein